MDAQDYFRGKRITVMGLGLLGGIGDIRYLAEQGAKLTLTDLKSPEELASSLEILKDFPDIRYTLGSHDLADFRDRDLIIKAPSTPMDSPYIAEAKRNGIPVTMWAALFCRFAHAQGAYIVGVTGTRGKTTTTALIADILTKAGRQVIAGGNLAHTAMLPHLHELTPDTIIVLELDSWKLQGFAEEHLSPNVAVFTTFFPDHQNYYHSLDTYLADKANIFRFQMPDDTLVLGEQCAELVRERHGHQMNARVIVADENVLPEPWKLRMPGVHNRYDAALALVAVRTLGVPDEISRAALESFPGVSGRLELVATRNGITFYNDTTATTPDATLAALRALSTGGTRVHLIMGGADKELDMGELVTELPKLATSVHLLAGSGTDRIKDALGSPLIHTQLTTAFSAALHSAEVGDTILLSPAFASFGMFKNEYDRGDQFVALVNAYGQ